jgi:hypothetical protein
MKSCHKWEEALPIVMQTGAKIYGGVVKDHNLFNEETLWTGRNIDYSMKELTGICKRIRETDMAGNQKEAEDLAMENYERSLPSESISAIR